MLLRGLIEGHLNENAGIDEQLKNYDSQRLFLKWILLMAGIFVPVTLIYTLANGTKHSANFRIVIPLFVSVILYLEFFVF
jgi:hypothetical protein